MKTKKEKKKKEVVYRYKTQDTSFQIQNESFFLPSFFA